MNVKCNIKSSRSDFDSRKALKKSGYMMKFQITVLQYLCDL